MNDDKQSVLLMQLFSTVTPDFDIKAHHPNNRDMLYPLRHNILFYDQLLSLPYRSHLFWSPGACQCDQDEYLSFRPEHLVIMARSDVDRGA